MDGFKGSLKLVDSSYKGKIGADLLREFKGRGFRIVATSPHKRIHS